MIVATEWPTLLHVASAFLLVGGLIAVAAATLCATRADASRGLLLRIIAFRTSLLLVLPSYVAVYGFGVWLADTEYGDGEEPDWLELAFPLTDVAGILAVVAGTIFHWWLLRRARAGELAGWPGRIGAALPLITLALLGVVVFLMSAKP